jgi:hypothetical protein
MDLIGYDRPGLPSNWTLIDASGGEVETTDDTHKARCWLLLPGVWLRNNVLRVTWGPTVVSHENRKRSGS